MQLCEVSPSTRAIKFGIQLLHYYPGIPAHYGGRLHQASAFVVRSGCAPRAWMGVDQVLRPGWYVPDVVAPHRACSHSLSPSPTYSRRRYRVVSRIISVIRFPVPSGPIAQSGFPWACNLVLWPTYGEPAVQTGMRAHYLLIKYCLCELSALSSFSPIHPTRSWRICILCVLILASWI